MLKTPPSLPTFSRLLSFQTSADSIASAPTPALELLDCTIAALEASLGLQPGDAVGAEAGTSSKKTGPARGGGEPRAKGKGHRESNKKIGANKKGWCSRVFFFQSKWGY